MIMHNIDKIMDQAKRIHMVGIGGSGMFPLAQILHSKGYLLSGSDNNETDTLARVRKMGIPVFMGHAAENISGAEAVVHTAAVHADNAELAAAREAGIPTFERSELLGYLTRRYSDAVCVCGTHGKTTVTSMLVQIFMTARMDPTAVIGGKLAAIDGSGRVGAGELMVCEACEFVDTFLKLSPDTCVLLNIDEDHLDYFKTLDNLIASFHRFCEMTTHRILFNGDDANTLRALEGIGGKELVSFGFADTNDFYPTNIQTTTPDASHIRRTTFTLMHRDAPVCELSLRIPGRHNILNAIAAAATALLEGAEPSAIREGLREFTGAGRRFEILGQVGGVTIADDYAHHPAELEVTLRAAMEMGYREVYAVFQPFTFSRTSILFEDFVRVLSIPDHCILTPIMGSREINTFGIHSEMLRDRIPGSVLRDTFEEVAREALSRAGEGDLVITLGCGDINKAAKLMLAQGEKK